MKRLGPRLPRWAYFFPPEPTPGDRPGGGGGETRPRRGRELCAAGLGERPRARIVIEASTDSEWVARCLEGLGHEVVVADPNFAPMYATRTRKVKTDRRDARAPAAPNPPGAHPPPSWRIPTRRSRA